MLNIKLCSVLNFYRYNFPLISVLFGYIELRLNRSQHKTNEKAFFLNVAYHKLTVMILYECVRIKSVKHYYLIILSYHTNEIMYYENTFETNIYIYMWLV